MSSLPDRTLRPLALAAATLLLNYGSAIASSHDETVVFDPASATVEFTLGDILHKVGGVFKLQNGVIHFDPETGKAGGSIVVDAASGDSGGSARDRRMHKNVLESGRFPEIVFAPDRVDGRLPVDGEARIQVHGVFRIHGAEHEMTLPFEVRTNAGRVTATTSFSVPYVKWGMKNPSTLILRVSDTVQISVSAVGRLSGEIPLETSQ